jgi:serine/threonine protein kinase
MEKTREQQDLTLYRLALGHELGVGAYSRVRFGKLIVKDLPQNLWPHLAVKIQDREVLEVQSYAANVAREIRVLQRANHPAIVRYIGSFTSRQSVYIAMEYMACGDLQGVLAAKGSLSEPATRFVTAEILSGLAYLHELGVVYGDLKPENVLLDDKNHAKLSDFGSVRIVRRPPDEGAGAGAEPCVWGEEEGEEEEQQGVGGSAGTSSADGGGGGDGGLRIEGTADYISPEVAAGVARSSFASDAWAFGCLVFQLLAGRVPILSGDGDDAQDGSEAERNNRMLRHIVKFTDALGAEGWKDELFGAKFPPGAQPLIRRLLSRAPEMRLDPPGGDGAGGRQGSGSNSVGEGIWRGVKADAFFEGIAFETLPEQQPPDFSTGIISAETAADRKWNRRKQSMMWSPMPDKYTVNASGSIPHLPEEPVGTRHFMKAVGAGALQGAGGTTVIGSGGRPCAVPLGRGGASAGVVVGAGIAPTRATGREHGEYAEDQVRVRVNGVDGGGIGGSRCERRVRLDADLRLNGGMPYSESCERERTWSDGEGLFFYETGRVGAPSSLLTNSLPPSPSQDDDGMIAEEDEDEAMKDVEEEESGEQEEWIGGAASRIAPSNDSSLRLLPPASASATLRRPPIAPRN